MTERCGRVIYAHVRDAGRREGKMVCETHLDWGKLEVAKRGYIPVVILARGETAASREWTSGCEAPKDAIRAPLI